MRKVINFLKYTAENADLNTETNPRMEVKGMRISDIYDCVKILEEHHQRSILETGAWSEPNTDEHVFDSELANALVNYLKQKGVNTCGDFGCGDGSYTKFFNEQGVKTDGYDGNPHTYGLTHGLCNVLDLTSDFELDKKYDCVMSLEVGEHIPEKFEQKFIDNITKHTNNLIVLSWAVPGQDGYGHVNCKENEYIRTQFIQRGFEPEMYMENIMRLTAHNGWFRNTILIFSKKK